MLFSIVYYILFVLSNLIFINCDEMILNLNEVNNTVVYHNFKLYIVYFAFIPPTSTNYDRRIKAHLTDLASTGLCNPDVHIVITISAFTNSEEDKRKMEIAVDIARNACNTAIIKSYYENT